MGRPWKSLRSISRNTPKHPSSKVRVSPSIPPCLTSCPRGHAAPTSSVRLPPPPLPPLPRINLSGTSNQIQIHPATLDDSNSDSDRINSQEWPASPPPASKRKISAVDPISSNPPPPAKKGRIVPILELSNRLGELTDVYRQSKSASTSTLTPTCQRAIKDVEDDLNLEMAKKVSLLNCFMHSATAVGIYTALPEGSEIRTAWAKDQYVQELAKRA